MPLVVGMTGGIGSGKSAAAEEFAKFGVTVVDSDAIAHELTAPGGAAIDAIRREFGASAITASGAMDRGRMRTIVFRDSHARSRLEAILHPAIRHQAERRLRESSSAYAIHMVPLLVESGDLRARYDRVLVIDCTESVQIERVRIRSGLTEGEIRGILLAQATRAERLAIADDVIDNSGPLNALAPQVLTMHEKYLKLTRNRELRL
jgi:dephospho-CoA kinase